MFALCAPVLGQSRPGKLVAGLCIIILEVAETDYHRLLAPTFHGPRILQQRPPQ